MAQARKPGEVHTGVQFIASAPLPVVVDVGELGFGKAVEVDKAAPGNVRAQFQDAQKVSWPIAVEY